MLGTIHFSDGHTEEITSWVNDRQKGLTRVHTKTGLYIDKIYYSYQFPFMSFMESTMTWNRTFPSFIHVYFERVMDISENNVVNDHYVRAAIDRIEYVRAQPKVRSSIPNLLAVLRTLNINLDILALYTGIKKTTLASYIDGSVKPRKETIDKIAKALNVSTDDLIRRDYIGREVAMLNAADNAAKKQQENKEIAASHFADYIRNGGRFG